MKIQVPCGEVEMIELPMLRDFGGDDDGRDRSDRLELPK
jgi:hypothetical protein